ncbi:ArsA family ATPase [Actinophytocola xanthii]|uniref:Arsenic-transporting ATPase n=1 Tax=Actinophytocola xanthii TaxID=1912961 RepID=A0A1Q8CRE9_9PSEU|nr:ArsA family ATPase [Actinophytocola xanthii]OLF16929.1 arsenic-transporting ATPase [Actinophytocola xanthii]
MRILLFTGKGGVGKTTLAAATAARLAVGGRKVLVCSADPAHSLGDAYGLPLGSTPSEVDTCLYAAHVDARGLVDRSWQELRRQLHTAFAGVGLDELDAAELTVLPGVDELLALTEVARLAERGPWDVVVVDCGPTAETLRLLALPEAVAGYLRRLRGPARTVLRHSADPLGRLAEHLGRLRRLLVDPAVTSVRVVLTPERLVVAETRRTLAALALRGIRVDGLVANRLAPRASRWRGPAASWLRTRRAEQDAVLAELDASTSLPVHLVEHRAVEPVGTGRLLELAEELYGEADPLLAPFAAAEPPPLLRLRAVSDSVHELGIALPLSDSSSLELARVGDDLAITVDGVRRLVSLPVLLHRHAVTDAEANEAGLVLRFEAEAGTGAAEPGRPA